MKKFNKIMTVLMVAVAVFAFVSPVFGVDFNQSTITGLGGTANEDLKLVTGNIWKTVAVIIQVLAVAAVVFAGLRYMFASADAKADIKKQTIILVVGAVLVFGAAQILTLVQTASRDLVN